MVVDKNMRKYILSSENKITKIFIFIGMFLFVFGIAKLGNEDYTFEKNQRAYYMILVAVISLLISFYRVRKERALENNENGMSK